MALYPLGNPGPLPISKLNPPVKTFCVEANRLAGPEGEDVVDILGGRRVFVCSPPKESQKLLKGKIPSLCHAQ